MAYALNRIEAGGRRIAYREAGSGPVVLFLHGIGSGSATYDWQLEGLSAGWRVIAWDAPGYGGSDPLPDATPDVADYAASVAALLDALDIDRAHVIGHSMGALIAAAFSARHADRVGSLVLTDPTAGYANAPDEIRVGRLAARIDAIERLGPAGMAESRAGEVLSPDASPEALARVRAVMSGLHPAGYAQAARMLHGSDIFADTSAIAAPTLVMCGSEDKVTPEELCRRIAAAIDAAAYRTLPGVGHASNVENPAQFNAFVSEFLERHR